MRVVEPDDLVGPRHPSAAHHPRAGHRAVHVQRRQPRRRERRPAARAPTRGRRRGTRASDPSPRPCRRARRTARRARARRAAAGRSDSAAACRSLRTRSASATGSPARSACSTPGSTSGVARASADVSGRRRRRRAARRGGRRPPGVDRPSLAGTHDPVEAALRERRAQLVAAPGADRGAAHERERHVGAEARGEPVQLGAAEVGAPQRVARDEGGRGIRRSAAHAAGDRHVLVDVEMHAAVVARSSARAGAPRAARGCGRRPGTPDDVDACPRPTTVKSAAGSAHTSSYSETA